MPRRPRTSRTQGNRSAMVPALPLKRTMAARAPSSASSRRPSTPPTIRAALRTGPPRIGARTLGPTTGFCRSNLQQSVTVRTLAGKRPHFSGSRGWEPGGSQGTAGFEAEGGGVPNDQVVQEAKPNPGRGSIHRLGELPVLVRRGGVSAGVVMRQNEAASLVGKSPLDDLPDIDNRLIHRPPVQAFRPGHGVSGVHKRHVHLLIPQALELGTKIGGYIAYGPRVDLRPTGVF